MVSSDFVSVNHIIADVTVTVDDMAFRKGFSKSWFVSRIQDALQELALDTFYQKIQKDFEIPSTLQIKMPPNTFNIREIYLYNGTLCNPSGDKQNVYWKRLFNNNYEGDGYTAKVTDNGGNADDPFVGSFNRERQRGYYGTSGVKYYANEQNGIIMLSRDCISYKYVRMIFNGMGVAIGDEPIVPRFFEQAVKDWVVVAYYKAMKSRHPRTYRTLWMDAKNDLEDPANGSWNKAKKRVKSMNTYEKESMSEYLSDMYFK